MELFDKKFVYFMWDDKLEGQKGFVANYIDELKEKNAELQGSERYRPKWHDVAGGDLPPEDSEVLALLADKEIYMAHFYRGNVWDKIVPVVAWCEIPQYTEE